MNSFPGNTATKNAPAIGPAHLLRMRSKRAATLSRRQQTEVPRRVRRDREVDTSSETGELVGELPQRPQPSRPRRTDRARPPKPSIARVLPGKSLVDYHRGAMVSTVSIRVRVERFEFGSALNLNGEASMSPIPFPDPRSMAAVSGGGARRVDPGVVAQLAHLSLANQGVLCEASCIAVALCLSRPGWHDVELRLPFRTDCDELRDGATIGSLVASDLAKIVRTNVVRVAFVSAPLGGTTLSKLLAVGDAPGAELV